MPTVLKILGVLIPILIGLGFRLARVFSDQEGEVLRRFVVRFTVPVMVFFSTYGAARSDISAMPAMMASVVILTAVLFPAGYLCSLLFDGMGRRTAVHACCIFGNYGWLGYGVAEVLLGDAGFLRAVFFATLWWPVFYGFGLPIGLIHARRRERGVPLGKALSVTLPALAALAAGLALNFSGWQWSKDNLLRATLERFGNMTVPLILFSVGVMLDISGAHKAFRAALLVSAVQLVLTPLVGWAIASILTSDPTSRAVIILQAAMPVATLTPVLAENFEMDMDVANTSIVVSTILSMITLPVVACLVVPP